MNADTYVKEFKANNYSNFSEFYDLTHKHVYYTALSVLSDHALAEDVVQDVYIAFLETVDGYKYGSNVLSYLTVIARNKSINVYNKHKKVVYNDDALTTAKIDVDFESNASAQQILALLDNEDERNIVAYHVILGYKFIEIANILSKPLGTVLWRYNKALKTLREKVGEFYD